MSAPWIVAKVCAAEDLVQQASKLLIEARLDIARLDAARVSGEGQGGEGPEAARAELAGVAERLEQAASDLGPAVRRTASLIAEPE